MALVGDPRRQRLVGLLLLGIAAVLLLSSPTWFAGDRQLIGVVQLVVAVLVAAAGGVLLRRTGTAGRSGDGP